MPMHSEQKTKQMIWLSVVIALLFLLATFAASSWRFPLSSEKTLLQWFSFISRYSDHEMGDSLLLIDTHYDKQMLMEYNLEGDSMGFVAATNRTHLNALLDYLKKKNDYRYILLDVSFDKTLLQPSDKNDKNLYCLIASIPRIGFAKDTVELAVSDTCFTEKAGTVCYYTTAMEDDFVKFPYVIDGEKSLPLKMYEELSSNQIKKRGLLYWEGGLMRSSAILTFDVTEEEFKKRHVIHNLSSLVKYDFSPIEGETGKYILIGDFEDDRHSTYLNLSGEPGPIINFNAYLSLANGHHRISLWMTILLFLTFWFLAYRTLRQSEFTWLFMWIGYPIFLFVICFVIYLIFREVYDVLITTTLFYSLKTVTDSIREREIILKRIKQVSNQIKSKKNICVHFLRNIWQ